MPSNPVQTLPCRHTLNVFGERKDTLFYDGPSVKTWDIAWSADGATLAQCCLGGETDREVVLWNAATGEEGQRLAVDKEDLSSSELTCTRNFLYGSAFSPDSASLASGFLRGGRVWDTRTGQVRAVLEASGEAVGCVVFSPDGALLACSSASDLSTRLWDMRETHSGEMRHTLALDVIAAEGERGDVDAGAQALAFSPDGSVLGVVGDEGAALFDVGSGQLLHRLDVGAEAMDFKFTLSRVRVLAFSPDGSTVAVGMLHGIALWNTASGQLQRAFINEEHGSWLSAFAPSGAMAATITRTVTMGESWLEAQDDVTLWDTASGAALHVLPGCKGSKGAIGHMCFSPDSTRLVTGSDNARTRVWDTASGALLFELKSHRDSEFVRFLSFAPDSATLAVVESTHVIKLWDMTASEEACAAATARQAEEEAEEEEARLAEEEAQRVLANQPREYV